jgi:SAM-dependent methyltransferase
MMGRHTADLQRFWSVDTLEQAMHERVTVPPQPEAWTDEVQGAVADALFADVPVAGRHIVDFGCGVGRLTRPLALRGAVVHAVDVSPRMLEFCRDYCTGAGQVCLHLSDGYCVPVPDRSMDGAFSVYVFQHMPDEPMIVAVLRDLHRALKPGGWLKLQSVDHRGAAAPEQVGMHGIRQSAEALGRLAETVGFKVTGIAENKHADHDYFLLTLIARELPRVVDVLPDPRPVAGKASGTCTFRDQAPATLRSCDSRQPLTSYPSSAPPRD